MCAKNGVHRALGGRGELFFSLSELQILVEQENSCVSVVTTKRSISLMPLHLKNLKASVKELLKARVNRYDVQLEGVILAHKNVKLMVNSTLLSDSRYFHLEYLADVYVFKPKVGNKLTGVVNKVTKEYVNILVHGIFNVTSYPSGSQELGDLMIGCQVVVKVTALDYTGQLPFIKATIISTSNERLAEGTPTNLKEKKKSRAHEEGQTSLIGISQREDQSSVIGVSQRNKELVSILKNSPLRIARQSSSELESQDAESSSTESSKAKDKRVTPAPEPEQEVVDAPRKKKKKKKYKSDEVAIDEKSSNKRKREEEDGGDSVSPKKKKKKEKHRGKEIREGNEQATTTPKAKQESAAITPLDSTFQIQANESIFRAASSTPLGPPPSPKKRKRKNSAKAEQSALMDSLLQLKMEEMASSTMDTSCAKIKSKSKKVKVEQEEVGNNANRDDSSSADAHSQPKKKKKKKKDEDSALDDLAKAMFTQGLKSRKREV